MDAEGKFLYDMRRTETLEELLRCCDAHLLGEKATQVYPDEPHRGLLARPTRESQPSCEL